MNRSTKSRIFRTFALCAVSAAMLLPGSCGKPKTEVTKIAVITKQDISFWHDVKNGAEDAGDELGVAILYNEGSSHDYPTGDNDYATQIEYINNAINEKVDAIVIAPNGVTELNDALARADAAGIKIININSRADYDGVISCVSSSDKDGGAVAARHAGEAILANTDIRKAIAEKADLQTVTELGSGAIAIIGHTAATADNRIAGFKEGCVTAIAGQMARDGIHLDVGGRQGSPEEINAFFQPFYVEGERCATVDDAYEEAKKLLGKDGKNVKAFFATNTNTTLGVCKAIEELGLSESVYVIGFNSDEQELDYLRSGILDGTVIQNPYNIGYVGVSYAKRATEDVSLPQSLDTGVTYVTSQNMTDEYIQLLLYPDQY